MELTYTNHNRVEQGIIQDFSLDLAFGSDENNFEIKTAENVMTQGCFWYVPDTEYGGIIDEIEATTNDATIIYRGRSFQGILDGYNMIDIKSFNGLVVDGDKIIINGKPSDILRGIIDQLDLPFDANIENEDVVSATLERNQGVYSFLRNAFEPNSYKIKFDTFTITITGAIDYASDDYYDTTQYTVQVKSSNQRPNHLIGINKRDGENTIIKHLYFDENGVVQPYYELDSMHGLEPLHDYEYERVSDNKVITGIDEVVEVIEGGSTVETMDLVTELTEHDGNTPFVDGKPADWDENVYTDYYTIDGVDEETGELKYANPKVENEYEEFTIHEQGTDEYSEYWWNLHWNECYKRSGTSPDYVFTQLSEQDCHTEIQADPYNPSRSDWEKNYASYSYRVSTNEYQNFEGIPVYAYERQINKGTAWDENRGGFYIKAKKYKWKIVSKWNDNKKTQWVYDSLSNASPDGKKTFKQYFGKITGKSDKKKIGNTTWIVYAPVEYWNGWMSLNDYCAYKKTKVENVQWEKGKYYLRYEKYKKAPAYPPSLQPYKVYDMIDSVPPTQSGSTKIKYYYPKDLVKPKFEQGLYYRKVKNNYGELIKKMLEKYAEIVDKLNTVKPDIDVDVAEFDIGDIVGSVHPFTNEQLVAKISKKIVKGGSDGVTVSYEIG